MADIEMDANPLGYISPQLRAMLPLDNNNELLLAMEYLMSTTGNEMGAHFEDMWAEDEIDDEMLIIFFYRMKKMVDYIKKSHVMKEFIEHFDKHKDGKTVSVRGIKFGKRRKTMYDYKACGHPYYDQLKANIKQMETAFKNMTPQNEPGHVERTYKDPRTKAIITYKGPLKKETEYLQGDRNL